MSPQSVVRSSVWDSFARALGTEARDYKVVTGVSGLEHPVQMLGVDEKRNRLVIVSSEPNARVAALMQVDVQAAMPAMKVLVAAFALFRAGANGFKRNHGALLAFLSSGCRAPKTSWSIHLKHGV